jgi:hypothetical protein
MRKLSLNAPAHRREECMEFSFQQNERHLRSSGEPTTWVKTWVTSADHRFLIGEFDRHRFRREKTVDGGRFFIYRRKREGA